MPASHMSPKTKATKTPSSESKPATPQGATAGKIAVAMIACVVVSILLVYLAGVWLFSHRFPPNTYMGGTSISMMTTADAAAEVSKTTSDSVLQVSGQGLSFTVKSQDAGLMTNDESAVDEARSHYNPWSWPIYLAVPHDETEALASNFDTDRLRAYLAGIIDPYNASRDDPSDAFLYFDDSVSSFLINPGVVSTKLDIDSVMDAVMQSMSNHKPYMGLTSSHLMQQDVSADSPALLQAQQVANELVNVWIDIQMGGNVVDTITPSVASDWIRIGDDLSVNYDDEKVVAWVAALEAKLDTVGTTRTYIRPDGKSITVSGGSYGWLTDGAQLLAMMREAIYHRTTTIVDVPLKQSAATFNPGGQDWGLRYVDIDLSNQYVWFFGDDGSVIWSSNCVSGNYGNHDTPTGVYYVTAMSRDQTLIGLPDDTGEPEYETPVSYWMPFIGNAIGLHDADWRGEFGGNIYTYNGSHGCVNLPVWAAAELYGILKVGDVVVVHY